jgi:hypothetical protein
VTASTPAPSWLLPLACALVPALAVHAAWLLSLQAGTVPDCIPHLEGCTSISRAARHGSANLLFKALMLPCALVQALHWRAAARWSGARSVGAAGLVAALALAAYTAALGTEGAFYQWMRRFGITFYFGATFLAMLAYLRPLQAGGKQRLLVRAMLATCALMLALGLASVAASATLADPALKDRVENVLEWQLGVLLTAWFLMQARLWRRARRPHASGGAG